MLIQQTPLNRFNISHLSGVYCIYIIDLFTNNGTSASGVSSSLLESASDPCVSPVSPVSPWGGESLNRCAADAECLPSHGTAL